MTDHPEQPRWVKPLADWQRIFSETPDYDCWPAPIRGWEVGALVECIAEQDAEVTRLRQELADYKGSQPIWIAVDDVDKLRQELAEMKKQLRLTYMDWQNTKKDLTD